MVAKKKLVVQVNEDLSEMSVVELKAMCRDLGLSGCSSAKKADLIRMIMGAQRTEEKEFTVGGDEDSEEKPKKKVAKSVKKAKSPVKKVAKKAKSPAKKKAPVKKAKSPMKKTGGYSTMLLSELKKECKSRGMTVAECNLKKADLIALLQESEGAKKEKTPVKKEKSPVKKVAKKTKSPVKKVAKKAKSPVKKAAKKSPVKKAARCDDKEDPLQCKDGSLCSATSGKCLKDTVGNRKGKAELRVDGRVIVGTAETISNLQKILGGEIVGAKKASSPVKKTKSPVRSRSDSPVKKSPIKKKTPIKKAKSPVRKSSSPVKRKSPVKKAKSPVKKASSPAKKTKTPVSARRNASPKDVKGIEKRLEELLAEDMQDEGEITRLQAKLKALKGKKAASPISAKKAGKVEMKKQEIYDTFKKCLESLKA